MIIIHLNTRGESECKWEKVGGLGVSIGAVAGLKLHLAEGREGKMSPVRLPVPAGSDLTPFRAVSQLVRAPQIMMIIIINKTIRLGSR